MTYFRGRFDSARRMLIRPRTALRYLFDCALRSIGAPADGVTLDMTRAMAEAWEGDNGPATWEKVAGYAAGLDDSRELLAPLSHPALQAVAEGLTQIGKDHGVKGTIFANVVIDQRHGRVVASLVFDLWGPDEVPLWEPGDGFADRMQARVVAVAKAVAEPGSGFGQLLISKDTGRVGAQLVFTLKGWNATSQANEAACGCGRSAPCVPGQVEITLTPAYPDAAANGTTPHRAG